MQLPQNVAACMDRLNAAGFSAYAVGGCVRDHLLGHAPKDFDLCTNATPEQTEAVFADCRLVLAGKKHGTVGVVADGAVVEITTFRTEGEYRDNRHPDRVAFVDRIESDLARRDFTINAMAWSPKTGLVDPFGGQRDLDCGVLRAVGDPRERFREDALRILRGVRFAVRFRMQVEDATFRAMLDTVHLLDNLARERVFDELCKLLPLVTREDLLTFQPILTQVLPELAPMVGFQQHTPHHRYDVYTHTAHVVAGVPAHLPLRWAALLHDIGKISAFTMDEDGIGHFYGHAQISADMANAALLRLKAPTALREQVVTLIRLHMLWLQPEKKQLRRYLGKLGYDTLSDIFTLQQADTAGKGVDWSAEEAQFAALRQLLEQLREEDSCFSLKDLAVGGNDLMALGYTGKAIGLQLQLLLEQVMDEQLPNEKDALLRAAVANIPPKN